MAGGWQVRVGTSPNEIRRTYEPWISEAMQRLDNVQKRLGGLRVWTKKVTRAWCSRLKFQLANLATDA
jgi:hypothetical protein